MTLHKTQLADNGGKRHLNRVLLIVLVLVCLVLGLLGCNPQSPALHNQKDFNAFILNTVQFICLVLIVYYLIVLNPARVREEAQAKFLRELKKNDEVMTSSGFFARVAAVAPEFITLELSSGVRVKVDPQHVRPVKKKEPGAETGRKDRPKEVKKTEN